jgi:predicted MPP superfamily phosphohydrolase
MITTADKLSIVTWAFNLFSVLILLLISLSWYRKKRLSLFGKVAILLVLAGMASFADAYWIEPNWLKTEHVVIHDPELAEVLEGVKVVQISDIHLQGGLGNLERNLIAEINALKPDLLFITGDFFSDKQKMELATEVLALSELIRSFKTTTGIFGVPGNYDGPLKNPAIMKKIKAAGIDVLINENRAVALPNHKTLYLAGFGYFRRKNEKLKTFSGIPSDVPVVLLAHDPDNFDEAIEAGVNLLLVGHTHGGQIGIPFLVEKSKKANKSPFMRGLFVRGRTKMYVNRGIATTHVPIRFFNRPEITVIKVIGDK